MLYKLYDAVHSYQYSCTGDVRISYTVFQKLWSAPVSTRLFNAYAFYFYGALTLRSARVPRS